MYHRTKATSSACGITGALAGMMAYSGHVPHVVHSPNDFPTHGRYTCYLPQAQRALVNPRQDDDISLTNKRMTMQRKTRGGCRHLEQIRTVETVMQKYVGTFAQKSGFSRKDISGKGYGSVARSTVANQHRGVHTGGTKRTHKPQCDNSRTAAVVAMTNEYRFHRDFNRRERTAASSPTGIFSRRTAIRTKSKIRTARAAPVRRAPIPIAGSAYIPTAYIPAAMPK